MTRKIAFLAMTVLVAITIIMSACGGSNTGGESTTAKATAIIPAPPRGITGNISTGESIQSSPIPVTPQGGSFRLNQADSPINGMVLDVPAGAYENNMEFKISYATINKHSFGEAFNPLTPLIKVDNGGAYADEIMEVTIPVNVPADSFAMGFIYDEKTKKLQGLPTLAQDADSITIGTRHFTDILVSWISLPELKKDIDTGFRPGIDDWQFVNRGSYIEQGGHCAGQSVTALWYYVTQPDGKDLTLNGRYDNNAQKPATPDLWQDDSYGYRFASTIQKDINWSSFENKFWEDLAGVNDELTYKLFAYSMQLTGEPQEVGIFSNAGGGHDMICYRIKDGNLYIADPNYPGNTERRIEFKNNKFEPYNSGANADEIAAGNGKAYEKIQYCAKTTTVSWDKISQRWAEFKAQTIGNGVFPDYKIVYKDDKGDYPELIDGFTSSDKLIAITTQSATPNTGCYVYRDGVQLKWDANGNYELKNGNNQLGIYVVAMIDKVDKTGNPIKVPKFVDFKYINVMYSTLTLNPPSMELFPDQSTGFSLTLPEGAPEGSHFEWYVDGALQKTGYDFLIMVSFPDVGQHTIVVKVIDSKNKAVLQAQGIAIVKALPTPTPMGTNLMALQKMTHLRSGFKGKWTTEKWLPSGSKTEDSFFYYEIPWYPVSSDPDIEIVWSGTSFSGTKASGGYSGEVKGSVNADGTMMTSLEWQYAYTKHNVTSSGTVWDSKDTLTMKYQNIPIRQLVYEKSMDEKFSFSKGGAGVKDYVTEITFNAVQIKDGEKNYETSSDLEAILWDDASFQGTPSLSVTMAVKPMSW